VTTTHVTKVRHCDALPDVLPFRATMDPHGGNAVQPSSAVQTPLPCASAAPTPSDGRVLAAWREWLGCLATNAEAALAAAMAYKELDGVGRDQWLDALEHDAHCVDVPLIAVYAPLLAVESDQDRRARITDAIGPTDLAATPRSHVRALSGRSAGGLHVAVIVSPLYLDFVQVLACGYLPRSGFEWVRHDPIVQGSHALRSGEHLLGAALEAAPLKCVIDELAHAVLAHRRYGREIPEALRIFADLFGPGAGTTPSRD
jgi:hypothetical protein